MPTSAETLCNLYRVPKHTNPCYHPLVYRIYPTILSPLLFDVPLAIPSDQKQMGPIDFAILETWSVYKNVF